MSAVIGYVKGIMTYMNDDNRYSSCFPNDHDRSVNILIGEIATLLANAVNKENDANGVAVGFRAILFCLAQKDGITQLEIARKVGIKPPTASVTLVKMETEGYITREAPKNDLRKIIVRLTDKGRETVNNMLEVFFECDRVIASVLTKNELSTLTDLLQRVKDRVYAEKDARTSESISE